MKKCLNIFHNHITFYFNNFEEIKYFFKVIIPTLVYFYTTKTNEILM